MENTKKLKKKKKYPNTKLFPIFNGQNIDKIAISELKIFFRSLSEIMKRRQRNGTLVASLPSPAKAFICGVCHMRYVQELNLIKPINRKHGTSKYTRIRGGWGRLSSIDDH